MSVPYEIVVEHDTPVSLDAIGETVFLIRKACKLAAEQFLHTEAFQRLDMPADMQDTFQSFLIKEAQNAFSLESVEPGSSKFKGRIGGFLIYCIALTISATGGRIAFDVIEDTQLYQEIQPRMVQVTNDFVSLVIENLEKLGNERQGTEKLNLHVELVGDRVRITVHPGWRQIDSVSKG